LREKGIRAIVIAPPEVREQIMQLNAPNLPADIIFPNFEKVLETCEGMK
jgi:hypothetical protein